MMTISELYLFLKNIMQQYDEVLLIFYIESANTDFMEEVGRHVFSRIENLACKQAA